MAYFRELAKKDKLETSPEQMEAFARVIPGIFRLSNEIKKDPALYHSRLRCFLHKYQYGGSCQLGIGHLLDLWEHGIYRDDEYFFFGGDGMGRFGILNGVNHISAASKFADVGAPGMLIAGGSLRGYDSNVSRVSLPRKSMPFDEFIKFVEENDPDKESYSIPEVRPAFVRRMEEAGRKPVMRYMEFVRIPHGKFLIGKTDNVHEILTLPFEGSPVEVAGFEMMPTPVTREMWHTVTGEFPAGDSKPSSPVTHVTWHDCVAFAGMLTEMDWQYDYSLPTEAQWEYACRAGAETDYPWGNDPEAPESRDFRRHYGSSNEIVPVGLGQANEWGMMDMWMGPAEWCLDRFNPAYLQHQKYYKREVGPGHRVIRGGYTFFPIPASMSGSRPPWYSDSRFGTARRFGLGFRLVRTRNIQREKTSVSNNP